MKLSRVTSLLAAAALALSGLAVSAPAEAATRTGVVVHYWENKVQVKPKQIEPFKDLIFQKVRWTKLTRSTGYATGVQRLNTCLPNCAQGKIVKTKVKLKFSRVRLSHCQRVFTRMRVTQVKSHRIRVIKLPTFSNKHC